MSLNHSAKTLALFNLLLVAGCSSTDGAGSLFPSAGSSAIQIQSDPAGAEVYAMGEKIGETPLRLNHQQVFPNTYPKEKESLYGRVTLKKAGCADLTRTVSTEIVSAGLRAQLDCGDRKSAPATPAREIPLAGETVEQRLNKINDLLGKGLITEDEAKKTRERILNEL